MKHLITTPELNKPIRVKHNKHFWLRTGGGDISKDLFKCKDKATLPENESTFQMHLLVLAAIYSFAVRIRNCLGRIYICMSANQKY